MKVYPTEQKEIPAFSSPEDLDLSCSQDCDGCLRPLARDRGIFKALEIFVINKHWCVYWATRKWKSTGLKTQKSDKKTRQFMTWVILIQSVSKNEKNAQLLY